MCLIGASMGGAIVAMFSAKYPSYVHTICLLAPPGEYYCLEVDVLELCDVVANEQSETELTRQLRAGASHVLLPETPEQLFTMIDALTVKKVKLPRIFLNGFLHLRLPLLTEHKKGNVRIDELHRETLVVELMQQCCRHSSNTTTRIWIGIISG